MSRWPDRFARGALVAVLVLLIASWMSCGDDSSTDPSGPTKGSISVTANVAGAAIFLNGSATGKTTDATLGDLDPGTYTVTVSLANYTVSPPSLDVTVEAGETKTAAFTLTPVERGAIAVSSDVAGALIYLDGAATAMTTPDTLTGLVIGAHTVRVELAGYEAIPESLDVVVAGDSTSQAMFTMNPTLGSIAVLSDVDGALIYMNGMATERTTPDTISLLEPGQYTINIELAGYSVSPSVRVADVEAGTTTIADFTMTAAAAQSRKVVVEHFSNTSCEPCVEPDLALEGAIASIGYDSVATFAVHLYWPSPSDPFYIANPTQNEERGVDLFGISELPQFHIDGATFGNAGNESALTAAIRTAAAVAPSYDIVVSKAVAGDSLVVSGSVYKRSATAGSDLIYAVIVQTGIDFNAPNGLEHFDDVVRSFLPGTDGESIDLDVGGTHAFRFARKLESNWDTDNLEVVVIVESASTRTVYQGASTR